MAKNILLVEFPDFGIPQNISSSFYEMAVAGMVPILTHPERNLTLMQKPEKLAQWLRMGCLVQVTAGSLTGGFGRGPQRIARELLDWGWVHVIATDAHNTSSRPPVMSKAFEFLSQHYGTETAELLCVQNPEAVFEGKGLPEQPEPARAFEEDEEFTAPQKTRPLLRVSPRMIGLRLDEFHLQKIERSLAERRVHGYPAPFDLVRLDYFALDTAMIL